MPTLNWIGKEAVVDHHRHVPTRLLECDADLSVGDPDAENLLVEGDNLEALKALLPRYRGQVKCIYIDPPYNTGNEGWVYNDNVNDPRIRKWLGDVVGKEAEDLCRHDKWLCMMYPRLALLREFLREDGAIFISIDDNELFSLKHVLDDVFGARNFRRCITWQRKYSVSNNYKGIATVVDFLLVYSRTEKFQNNLLPRTEESVERYANPDNDPRGPWKPVDYLNQASPEKRPNLCYDIVNPNTGEVIKNTKKAWKYEPEVHEKQVAENRLWWGTKGTNRVPALKLFLSEVRQGMTPHNWWPHEDAGHTDEAKKEIERIIGSNAFDTPKPIRLLQRILQIAAEKDSVILDSFAGSGTTAHAVLQLNKADGGSRRFILVEIDRAICQTVTKQRLTRAVEGYRELPALGSGFRYCRLGRTLLDEDGNVNGTVPFADLARYVFLLETGVPVPKRPRKDCPLLGVHRGRAVYLLYNGVLGDKRPSGGNVLTGAVLAALPPHPDGNGPRVIYGEACRLSDATLDREGITFRHVPYALREG